MKNTGMGNAMLRRWKSALWAGSGRSSQAFGNGCCPTAGYGSPLISGGELRRVGKSIGVSNPGNPCRREIHQDIFSVLIRTGTGNLKPYQPESLPGLSFLRWDWSLIFSSGRIAGLGVFFSFPFIRESP